MAQLFQAPHERLWLANAGQNQSAIHCLNLHSPDSQIASEESPADGHLANLVQGQRRLIRVPKAEIDE